MPTNKPETDAQALPGHVASTDRFGVSGAQWALACVLEFGDGGEPEGRVLHVGTEAECERLAGMMPAVAYNGARPVVRASMRWRPIE